jgi:uncharacterized membrane protein YvlD (DUF360 family)
VLPTCCGTRTAQSRSILKAFLLALAWLLFVIAALAFWVGGRVIHEFAEIDRILAEGLGLLIAFVIRMIGYVLKTTADDLDTSEDSSGQ